MTQKNKKKPKWYFLLWASSILLIAGIIVGIYYAEAGSRKTLSENIIENSEDSEANPNAGQEGSEEPEDNSKLDKETEELLEEAELQAKGYFYEEALKLLEDVKIEYADHEEVKASIEKYEKLRNLLTPYEGNIPHIFFHSLIVDTSKAFDGDHMSNGYNYWMTTVSEFEKMIEEMYRNGYILISIHDLFTTETNEDGSSSYQSEELLLPPGKIPFVLSIDDLNYYDYMKEDGFAKRLTIDKDGRVVCVYEENGVEKLGDYDVVPILDTFVEKNPDFSYRGAKGIIAETGYEGALGYRTNRPDSPTYEEDKETVKKIAERLKETGWEFAVHGYGHRHTNQISLEELKRDTEKWKAEVGSLVGETDVYIYPFGEEIEYPSKKLAHLQEEGFAVFCGVWSKDFLQIEDTYIRQTRRNLDGFSMNFRPASLSDLFNVQKVMDPSRPEFK